MLIDSHAHVYLNDFQDDLDEIVSQFKSSKILAVYMPNIDSSTIESLHHCEDVYEPLHAMMGLHPCSVKDNYKEELEIVKQWIEKREYAGLGEIGLDYYWDKSHINEQIHSFDYQIGLAKEHDLPIIIHSRDSLDDTIRMIEERQDGSLNGIFHCFNGTVDQGKKIIDAGFLLGIGGVVTFKNAGVDKTVKELPLESMVLETDAPYLTPSPFRGKRNEPSYIAYVAEKLSVIFDCELDNINNLTTRNCQNLFKY